MALVAVLCPDLLFGSKLEGGLKVAGHTVDRLDDEAGVRASLAASEVLVVDLTDDAVERAAMVEAMGAAGELEGVRTLGFYAHVEVDVRRRAEAAGFDLVVPRSRMAREMAALVERLLSDASR